MKLTVLGLAALATALFAGSAQAQCCGAAVMSYAQPVVSHPHHHAGTSAPYAISGTRVAYVSRLAQPIQRGDKTLAYAIHLTNGKTLLSHFVPVGHTVQGVENFTPGRLVSAAIAPDASGRMTVIDPTTSQPVTTLTPVSPASGQVPSGQATY